MDSLVLPRKAFTDGRSALTLFSPALVRNQLMLVNDILISTQKFVYFPYISLVPECCRKGDLSRGNLNSAAHL